MRVDPNTGHRWSGTHCDRCGISAWREAAMWPCKGPEHVKRPMSKVVDTPAPSTADGIEHGVGCSCIFCRG